LKKSKRLNFTIGKQFVSPEYSNHHKPGSPEVQQQLKMFLSKADWSFYGGGWIRATESSIYRPTYRSQADTHRLGLEETLTLSGV